MQNEMNCEQPVQSAIHISFHSISDCVTYMYQFFRIILMEDAIDCLMSFPDFLYAFQTQFFYEGKEDETEKIQDVVNKG